MGALRPFRRLRAALFTASADASVSTSGAPTTISRGRMDALGTGAATLTVLTLGATCSSCSMGAKSEVGSESPASSSLAKSGSTTTTVTLSRPPAASASRTSALHISSGRGCSSIVSLMTSSVIMLDRPSEHSISTSPFSTRNV